MSDTTSGSGPASPASSLRDRAGRVWTISAAVIVALIVLLAVVVIWATRGGDPGAPAPDQPASTSTPAAAGGGSPAAPAAQQEAVPDSPPAGVTWSLFQGVALPTSRTAGPSRVDGPVHAGYAHTPTGALLAVTQIGARYLVSPGDDWRRVVQQQVVPGSGRDVYAKERAKVTSPAPPGTYGQFAGFRFVTYTPNVAVIQLVSRFADGTLQVSTYTVQWVDGDWRLQLQPDGGASPTLQRVDNLSGFVPWGGV